VAVGVGVLPPATVVLNVIVLFAGFGSESSGRVELIDCCSTVPPGTPFEIFSTRSKLALAPDASGPEQSTSSPPVNKPHVKLAPLVCVIETNCMLFGQRSPTDVFAASGPALETPSAYVT